MLFSQLLHTIISQLAWTFWVQLWERSDWLKNTQI